MKHKLLATALCSSTLLLTACGGSSSSDNSNNNGNNSNGGNNTATSNVDYSKAKTIDFITTPVLGLATSEENGLTYIAHIAEEIHYSTTNSTATCTSGSVQKNSNGTVTLTNCKNIKFNGDTYPYAEGLTLSGTINSKITDTDTTEQYDITLSNFTVKYDDNEVETWHGNIVEKFVHGSSDLKAEYTVGKMELSWVDKTDKESYTLTDYRLTETYTSSSATPATAKGKLRGDVNGEKFSVNFDSDIEYGWSASALAINKATINIVDTTNSKNSISIKNTTNGKALISAYANGTSVSDYPKTVAWSYFN